MAGSFVNERMRHSKERGGVNVCGVICVWEDHPRCCGLASIEGVPVAVCPGVAGFNSNSVQGSGQTNHSKLWKIYMSIGLFFLLLGVTRATRVDEWLAGMSVTDKCGQMTQLDISMIIADGCPVRIDAAKLSDVLGRLRVGSILNTPFSGGSRCNKTGWTADEWRGVVQQIQVAASFESPPLPPLVLGIDSIHGANYVHGATLFPQQLGLAAAFDVNLTRAVGEASAKDTRAAGLHWLFSPVLGLGIQPLWARLYETFGEDPLLASRLGAAIVAGMQRPGEVGQTPGRAAATMKHFIGCAEYILAPSRPCPRAHARLECLTRRQVLGAAHRRGPRWELDPDAAAPPVLCALL